MLHSDLFFYVLFTVLSTETVSGIATDVRLVNNVANLDLKPYEGPIQVFEDGEWGLLQRNAINEVTAKTICKILGYGFIGFRVERFSYTGLFKLSRLTCYGNETSISECLQEPGASQSGIDAPGVHCFEHVFKDVRLSGGTAPNKGSVQVKMDGRWGLVCSYDQSSGTMPSPTVFSAICRSLGYRTYELSQSFEGYTYDGVELSWLDIQKLSCTGSETHFNQCTFQDVTQYQPRCYAKLVIGCITPLSEYCSSDDICAGVPNAICKDNICACKTGYGPDGQFNCSVYIFRLYTISEHLNEGLVEASNNGDWNLISETYATFSETTSKVLCKTLGFGYVGFSTWQIYDSSLGYTGEAGYSLPKCNGSEATVNECFDVIRFHIQLSSGIPLTRLHCFDSRINDIRLGGGAVPHEGIVEVRIGEKWGTVCYSSTSTEDEVCRLLGYTNSSTYYSSYSVTDISGIWLTSLNCNSTATDINECSFELGVTLFRGVPGCGYYQSELALGCTPIRLVDGATPNSGRLEAGFYGKLHTLCADEFDMAAANVTCKVLGYNEMTVVARLLLVVGDGEIGMLNASIKCNGSENSLEQCNISASEDFRCPSGKIAGLSCLSPLGSACKTDDICAELPNAHCMQYRCTCQEGFVQNGDMNCTAKYAFRLVPVNDQDAEGLVEIKLNNTWTLVTRAYSTFSDETAQVICATLGYGYTGFSTSSFPGLNVSYTGYFVDKLIECIGTETHAAACVTGDWVAQYQGTPSYPTRLHCYDYLVTDIRLQGGVLPNEGRVEVQIDGRWGSVCLNTLAYGNYHIRDDLCRFLGYVTDSIDYPSMTKVNADTVDEIWMSHPICNDTSVDIIDCAVTKGVADACQGHVYDLKLKCDPIRLRDGATPNAGQIQAGIRGELVSFCIDGFDINAANVTCTALGYYGVNRLLISDHNGTDIYNGEIICNGTETSLENCDHVDGGMINCKQSNVAYVECHGASKIIPSNNKSYEGVFVTYYMHKWRHIGKDVSDVTAKTLCNILGFGYKGYAVTVYDAIDGGTGMLKFLLCKGNESDVAECDSGINQSQGCYRCPQPTFGTVKLYCFAKDYMIDGIRLVDGELSTEGVIQVLVDGEWGHICAPGWNTTATNIVCRTRGFKSGVEFHSVDIANASIQIGHVECQGSESNLNECTFHRKSYYERIYSCHSTIAITCTDECDAAWYGQNCSAMCGCNDHNTETSENGRACDIVTGECTCKRAWSGATCDDDVNECLNILICQESNTQCKNTFGGYECICVQDYEINDNGTCVLVVIENDIAMLVIILSACVGGLLSILVVAAICLCTFRRRNTQGHLKDTPNTLPDRTIANSNVLAISIRSNATEEGYATIKDEPGRDVLDVNALRVARHQKDDYRDGVIQNTNHHTYTGLKTGQNDGYVDINAKEHYYTDLKTEQNRGYLQHNPASQKLTENYDYPYVGNRNNRNKNKPAIREYQNVNAVRRQLPTVPLEGEDNRRGSPANRAEMKDQYQGLVDRRLGENLYERKLDEDGYMKAMVPGK